MTKLSVNLNKVALVRNSRPIGIPSVRKAAEACIGAGAAGITVHPRPDERHIRRTDVFELAGLLGRCPQVEFNIEGNPFPEFMDLVKKAKPQQCTLVPDDPGQATSDHGWDAVRDGARLKAIVAELKAAGIRVSLFIDPVVAQIKAAAATGADRVELYTEPYARAFERGGVEASIKVYAEAARRAIDLGLGVNAGHDLNLENLGLFIREVPGVMEVSIGHALISDALELGLDGAVKAYLAVLAGANG